MPCTAGEDPNDSARVYAIGAENIRDADVARVRTVSTMDIETHKSIKEMERYPLFYAPKGWIDSTKEVTKLLIPSVNVVGMSTFHKAVAELGADNDDSDYIFAVFRVKCYVSASSPSAEAKFLMLDSRRAASQTSLSQ